MLNAPEPGERRRRGGGRLATVAVYGALFVFGLLQGLTGAFQYSRGPAGVPVTAACFAAVIGLTCWLSGLGTSAVGGAFAPAIGWMLAAFGTALPSRNGSVVITNTTAGEAFLYGGALAAAVGAVLCASAVGRIRSRLPQSGPGPSPDRFR